MDNFYSIISYANLMYGLDMNENDAIDIGLVAWNRIGNKQCRLYRYRAKIDKETLSVDLPCNCVFVEAVTYDYEDWKYTSNDTVNGDYQSQFIENYIESRKMYNNAFYISGKYAKYQQVGDTLYFEKDYGYVNILYKGVEVDDDELPYLTRKEVEAIACFCAYVDKHKQAMRSHQQIFFQEAQLLNQEWVRLCDAARVPEQLNQNDMNKILDAKTNFNRKLFNKSYKPLK